MKTIKQFFVAVMAIMSAALIMGCASIGAAPAASTSEQIDYGRGAVTGVATTCKQQLVANTMSLATAQKCLTMVDAANAGFDAASAALGAGDQPKALTALAAATSVLTELQTILQSKGK